MFNIFKNVIETSDFDLVEILRKIEVVWIKNELTDEEKTDLEELARSKAKPENSYGSVQEQINTINNVLKELESKKEEFAKEITAIKEEISKLGGEVVIPEEPEETEKEYPEFIRPTGGHDCYNIGDKIKFNGEIYECVINGCNWSPTEYPSGWKEVVSEESA